MKEMFKFNEILPHDEGGWFEREKKIFLINNSKETKVKIFEQGSDLFVVVYENEEKQKKQEQISLKIKDEEHPIKKLWNETTVGLPKVKHFSSARVKHFKARWKDYPDLELWKEAMLCIMKSDFLMGKTDAKYKTTVDFLLKPNKISLLLEGFYERNSSQLTGYEKMKREDQ